jgi:IS30 family transposase
MAPHGKQMTPEEKQIIVALSQQGYSSYTIAEMTGKNRRTISKFLRKFSQMTSAILRIHSWQTTVHFPEEDNFQFI